MPFQKDQFGHNAYIYEPKWTKDVDLNPDHRPADGGYVIEDRGDDVVLLLKVRGLGVLHLRGGNPKDWHGVSIFTDEQLQFTDADADATLRVREEAAPEAGHGTLRLPSGPVCDIGK